MGEPPRLHVPSEPGPIVRSSSGTTGLFWNWIDRSQADIEEFREAWTNGTLYGEVEGYDGPPIPAPQLPPVPLKARGRVC